MQDEFQVSTDKLRFLTIPSAPVLPFTDFSSASKAAVRYLRELTRYELCAVTRIDGSEILFLNVNESNYKIKPGDRLSLENTMCSKVLVEQLPKYIANTSGSLSAEKMSAIGLTLKVGAHIGVPLVMADRSLFGTICALNPRPMPELSPLQIGAIELIAMMLSTILSLELQSLDQRRSYERAKMESESDELTSLLNRRGWDRALQEEEILCAQYGFSASVMVIDLDNLKVVNDTHGHKAGDDLIRNAAEIIEQTCRSDDVVARTGGDEFAVLTKGISEEGLRAFARRIRIALMVAGVSASVGTSTRTLAKSLTDAWTEADEAMYVSKRSKG